MFWFNDVKKFIFGVMYLMGNNIRQTKKESNELLRDKEDFKSNRLMMLLVAATLFIVSLLLAKKNIINAEGIIIINALLYIQIAAGILFAAALVFFIIKKIKKHDEEDKYFKSSVLLGIAALILIIALLFKTILINGSVLFVIVAFLLYFLFCFYARDFFFYSVFTVLISIFMYLNSLYVSGGILKEIVKVSLRGISIVIPVLVIIGAFVLYRNGGYISFRNEKILFMKPSYKYYPFFITAVIAIASCILIMLVHTSLIYTLIVLFAFYLLNAIIYTVKMI